MQVVDSCSEGHEKIQRHADSTAQVRDTYIGGVSLLSLTHHTGLDMVPLSCMRHVDRDS